VTESGNVVARGESARGREYGFAGAQDGDRIVVGEAADGEIAVRAKGDFDDARYDLPHGYDTVYIGGHPYYRYGYDYYWPYYYGGTLYYQEIYPPPGVFVTNLPPEAGLVGAGEVEYFVADGVYYQEQGDGYVVVDTPVTSAGPYPSGPNAGEILNRMGAYLAGLTNFVVEFSETAVSPRKQADTVTTKRRVYVSRPNRISAAALSDQEDQRRFLYDGKSITVCDLGKKTYATIDAPDNMADALDLLRDEYAMNVPLADLLRPDAAEFLSEAAESLNYVTDETVAGHMCHKLTLMTDEVHGQLWIEASEATPRPRRVELLYFAHPGQPRYRAIIQKWDAQDKLDDQLFVFEPPEGAVKIEMVPRADQEPGS